MWTLYQNVNSDRFQIQFSRITRMMMNLFNRYMEFICMIVYLTWFIQDSCKLGRACFKGFGVMRMRREMKS